MIIKKITIQNYRGIKERQEINLSNFSSIVGKNDSGKSIVLNAIASFLDPKANPITDSDFNELDNPITLECHFYDSDLAEKLEKKIKSKIKKSDGLEEFIDDIIFENSIVIQKIVNQPKKGFDYENILMNDFEDADFSFMYNKSDEDLTSILEKYSIEIPVQGIGRNSKLEKIKHIKKYCLKECKPQKQKNIQDEYGITSILPAVELFFSDYGLEADTKFKTTSVSQIKDYFDGQISNKDGLLSKAESDISKEMVKEAKSIKDFMLDYTSSLKTVEIEPVFDWPKAIPNVNVKFQFENDDKPIPMTHKGTGYRRLFMVARFRYLAEKNKGKDIIYLIEEPETFLHPSAQEDLLNAFRELSENNQVIITTHSPIFAGATNIESLILCSKPNYSTYELAQSSSDQKFIQKIVDELGIKPSYNLRDNHEKIVFVESLNDAKFFQHLSEKLLNLKFTDNEKLLVLPLNGKDNIESFINIDYFSRSGRDLFLLIDSDKHTNQFEGQKLKAERFDEIEKTRSYILQKSCIENYYHPRAIERVIGCNADIFDFFQEDEDIKKTIDQVFIDNDLNYNFARKNNFFVFEEMTKEEWEYVVEQDLIDFMKEILE